MKDIPAIYQTKTCEYCGHKHNKAYYPPFCDSCGASLETGSKAPIEKEKELGG